MCAQIEFRQHRFDSCGVFARTMGVQIVDLVPTNLAIPPVPGMCLCAVDVQESARRNGMTALSLEKGRIYRLLPAA